MGCAKMAALEIHDIQNWTDNWEYPFAEVYWLIDQSSILLEMCRI